MLDDRAVHTVVDDDDQRTRPVGEGRGQLLAVHEEVTVTADRDRATLWEDERSRDRTGNGQTHRTVAGADEARGPTVLDEAVAPDRGIARPVRQDGFPAEAFV